MLKEGHKKKDKNEITNMVKKMDNKSLVCTISLLVQELLFRELNK